jgi:GDP-4-dehydro-6-deoxy-D-mannose reductase
VRILITGATGFAGHHLCALCRANGAEVHAITRTDVPDPAPPGVHEHPADLRDPAAVAAVIRDVRPDRVMHLAGASSVGQSFREPMLTWDVNLNGTLGVLEALRAEAPDVRTLLVTSGEVFGRVALEDLPVTEGTPMRPLSPYASSKAAADIAARQYRDTEGMPVLRVRAFNHIGPGQDARFVLPNVARQIAVAEHRGQDAVEVHLGNLETRRDFTDVRDMVRAYWLIMEHGDPDAVYVACSGASRPVRELVEGLVPHARIPVSFVSDAELRRSGEQPDLYGSPERLRDELGWAPEIPLETTLADTLQWWRERVAHEED